MSTTPVHTDSFSKEYVESLKTQLEQKNEEAAKLKAFKTAYDERTRTTILQMQPDIDAYMSELVASNPDQAADMQPIVDWSKTCHESQSLETTLPLARVISCASAQYKRTRDEASVLSEKATTLGDTMKELEAVKSERDAKVLRITELEELCNERQQNATKLQEELARIGGLKDKLDFSKLSSREVSTMPKDDATKAPTLAAATSLASRKEVEDELFAFVQSSSTGIATNRLLPSGTSHAFVGGGTRDMY